MQRQKPRRNKIFTATTRTVLVLAMVVAIGCEAVNVYADQFDDQISTLRSQNSDAQNIINGLASQADSYEGAIAALQTQISSLQTAIAANQARQSQLQQQIDEAKAKLEQQRKYLGDDIRAMYIDGQLSTIEELATSKSLSEYVDKEAYRTGIQNKISLKIKEINALRAELKKQKAEMDTLVASQQAQNSQLVAARSEQQQLLAFNQGQQAAYSSQISANNAQIIKLKAAQAAELARKYGSSGGVAGGGGYPWGGAVCIHTGSASGPCPNYDWAVNGSIWNWSTGGYGYRNCTDYVAWRINPGSGLGNAKDWPANASNIYRKPSDTSPRPGDAAVDQSGTYGHVMYVESVSGDGIVVSDYNRIGDGLYRMTSLTKVGDGQYRSPTGVVNNLVFVHF